jgi:hypothetical protein
MLWWRSNDAERGIKLGTSMKRSDAKDPQSGVRCNYSTDHSREWLREREFIMKLRILFLAAIALVVLAGSVVPASAKSHHHRHHHPHHHHS